jgi:hypothetical protein
MKEFITGTILILTVLLGISFFAGITSGGDSDCRDGRKHPRFLQYTGLIMAFDIGCYLGEKVD